ncbi:MAG: hypothetical protein WC326_02210 [Candidatus Delongbacteria bacterium]
MRTEQAGQALLLKAYQQEIAQRHVQGAERPVPAEENSAAPEADEAPRAPRELSKGRLLDIYG